MNVNEIIDNLDIASLRKILKDECNNNYKLAKLITNINSDNELMENNRLFDSYRRIDSIVEELDSFSYDLDNFDLSCNELANMLSDLDEDIKKGRYSYATKVASYMLSELSYSLDMYEDGICYVIDDNLDILNRLYSITRDNAILSTIMDSMDNDYFNHLKDELLIDFIDNENCKYILSYLEGLDFVPSSKLLDKLLNNSNITVDDRLGAYSSFKCLDNYIKSLELLLKEKDYTEFDSIYFSNKDEYEKDIKNSGLVKEYYFTIYNRHVIEDTKRALGALLNILEHAFDEDAYLKAVGLCGKDKIYQYLSSRGGIEGLASIELYNKNYQRAMDLIIKAKSISLYDKYLNTLGIMYKDSYLSFYTGHIFKLLASAKGREDYKAAALIAKKLVVIEIAKEGAIELYKKIKEEYPKKRALHEEFSFLVSYANK